MALHRIQDKASLGKMSGTWRNVPPVTIQFNINVRSSAESAARIGILACLMGMEPVHG
jgi:hypothetical protein